MTLTTPPSPHVIVDSERVVFVRAAGDEESVRWDELRAVIILTTDQGPLADDVFWVLAGSSKASGCVIPQGVAGEDALVDRLVALPGFNHQAMIDAMGSTSNQEFLCWRAPQV